MALILPLIRLLALLSNIWTTFKTSKLNQPGPRGTISQRSRAQRKRDLKGCLAIWVVWSFAVSVESVADVFIGFFPFYGEFKSVIWLFLFLSRSYGAEPIFLHVIRPLVRPYVTPIDSVLDLLRLLADLALALMLLPWQHAVAWWHRSSDDRNDATSNGGAQEAIEMRERTGPVTRAQLRDASQKAQTVLSGIDEARQKVADNLETQRVTAPRAARVRTRVTELVKISANGEGSSKRSGIYQFVDPLTLGLDDDERPPQLRTRRRNLDTSTAWEPEASVEKGSTETDRVSSNATPSNHPLSWDDPLAATSQTNGLSLPDNVSAPMDVDPADVSLDTWSRYPPIPAAYPPTPAPPRPLDLSNRLQLPRMARPNFESATISETVVSVEQSVFPIEPDRPLGDRSGAERNAVSHGIEKEDSSEAAVDAPSTEIDGSISDQEGPRRSARPPGSSSSSREELVEESALGTASGSVESTRTNTRGPSRPPSRTSLRSEPADKKVPRKRPLAQQKPSVPPQPPTTRERRTRVTRGSTTVQKESDTPPAGPKSDEDDAVVDENGGIKKRRKLIRGPGSLSDVEAGPRPALVSTENTGEVIVIDLEDDGKIAQPGPDEGKTAGRRGRKTETAAKPVINGATATRTRIPKDGPAAGQRPKRSAKT